MDEGEKVRQWVKNWKEAGPKLDAIRRREIGEADKLKNAGAAGGRFQSGTANHTLLRPSSRTVQMRRWLAK